MGPIIARTPITSASRKKPKEPAKSSGMKDPPSEKNLANIHGTLDSGADCTTIPEDVAANLPTNQEMHIGDYPVCIMPTEAAQTLISVGEVVDEGHTVLFGEEFVRISDKGGMYQVTYDREAPRHGKFARQWRIPLAILMELTNQRRKFYPTIDTNDDDQQGSSSNQSSSGSSSEHSSSSSSSSFGKPPPRKRGTQSNLQQTLPTTDTTVPSPRQTKDVNRTNTRRPSRFAPLPINHHQQRSPTPPLLIPNASGSALIPASPDAIDTADSDDSVSNYFMYSARIRRLPEEVMCCQAVKGPMPLWKGTGIEPWEIRRVFHRSQCLACILQRRG
mmetsp:Transcript_25886/g.37124  ORF Transcript_25886/g.37124 Transcript_25886/m.37124 type:complete len:332 (-) Transcript_25886:2003-2998(-)